jgi:hypothetical protein
MSLKEKINLVKQQLEINEIDTMALEKSIGKKLVDYDSIDALVAALMGYYNPLIKGISETFKNFCPYAIGDIYLTTLSTNPATKYLGTTWQKIEGRFLLGTSGSGASKAAGGSNSKTIAQANLPNIKLSVNSFSLSRGTMDITGSVGMQNDIGLITSGGEDTLPTGAFTKGTRRSNRINGYSGTGTYDIKLEASRNWTGTTSSASPQTSELGSGQALDITPSYYTCHMWLRLT